MTCDDILAALEAGDGASASGARRHLEHCADCRAAMETFASLKRSLSEPAPLCDEDELRWLAAPATVAPLSPTADRPPGRRTLLALLAAVAAVAALASIFLQPQTDSERTVAQQPSQAVDSPGPAEPAEEQAAKNERWLALDADVANMRREIERLRQRAELLDVRDEVNRLLLAFDP